MRDELMFACQACAIGYHWECMAPVDREDGSYLCCCSLVRDVRGVPDDEDEEGADRAITNNLTTGRKRAGRLVPILTGMMCEWAGLRYAGGGIVPIIGCRGNVLAKVKKGADLPEGTDSRGELHHGPDKTTLNNAPGTNLHRICSNCHHRWHALNDPFYDKARPGPEEPWLPVAGDGQRVWPHDQFTEADPDEMDMSEEWWAVRTEDRPPYPFGRS
jgi:hypothetical protein